ncbi:uncharacterized protein LOC133850702 [Drosophila sulfurigaster albostrigata]|uniref:uncharacterized protein LOC133850702 n=1 Tax=Drosophila sulfurigaster albostrigata TaxID=89887 RepID=UPI002D21AD61|nr:uncharacterized protein LOC133850702 [Drosophila sulfurigaster albostrigata]
MEISAFFKALILCLDFASAYNYRLILENEEIFTTCSHQPSNVLAASNFFDLSELHTKEIGDKIEVSGNVTSIWNYEPTDRLQASITGLRYERGEWINALLSMNVHDVCSLLYDKRQYWYKFWTQYITNVEDVKDKCFLNGTKLIHKTFIYDININIITLIPEGRYKVVVIIKAIDKRQKVRNPIFCIEILGDVKRS